ncbi:MAG: hypothetical protein J6Y64_03360 [Ruminococcus sp.]|nr:hypothetical protein [Ruminococcus sp.]
MSHDYDNTRNRFNPQNRFIGDIENGKRYPFGCYSKEEADEKFALKSDLEALAANVTEINTQIADILRRLDALEYKAINIQTFTASPATIERGSNATVNLTWSLNKAATTQTINGSAVQGTSMQATNISETTSFRLEVSDGETSATKTATVTAANQIYYGAAADFSTVTSLTKVLSDNKKRTITVNAGQGQYIIYAYPARLGDVTFFVDSWEGGFEPAVEQSITNASGYTETYKLYRSTNANLGETTVEIKEG